MCELVEHSHGNNEILQVHSLLNKYDSHSNINRQFSLPRAGRRFSMHGKPHLHQQDGLQFVQSVLPRQMHFP